MRVGNALLLNYDEKRQVKQAHLARRGLKVTFELGEEHLENLEKLEEIQDKHELEDVQQIIFGNAIKHLHSSEDCTLDVVKVFQCDGIPVQISYDEFAGCWLVGSRTHTIAVQGLNDIAEYSDKEFYAVKRAAKCFLGGLARLSPKLQQAFQDDLSRNTLVGDYSGDYNLQGIVRYRKQEISYYAVVLTSKVSECLPPDEAFELFEKYRLSHSGFEKFKQIKLEENLVRSLSQIMHEVRSSNLEAQDKGALLYLVLKRNDMQKVTSLAEIQTLEYKIYSELQTRILNLLQSQKDANDDFEEFKDTLYKLVGDADLHHSINYYLNVADTAYMYCCESNDDLNYLRNNFSTLLSVVIYCLHQNISVSHKIFKEKKKVAQIEANSWYNYSMGNLNLLNIDNRKGLKKTRSKEPEYSKKVPTGSQASHSHKHDEKSPDAKEDPAPEAPQLTQPQTPELISLDGPCSIAVFLPLTLPGMGVSRYFSNIQALAERTQVAASFATVDFEKIRVRVNEEQKSNKSKLGIEEYLRLVNEICARRLEEEVKEAVQAMQKSERKVSFVFVLRHFNTQSSKKLIEHLRSQVLLRSADAQLRFFCLSNTSFRVEPNLSLEVNGRLVNFPFNSYFLLACLKRQLWHFKKLDKQHEAESSSFIENTTALFKHFEGCELSPAASKKLGFDGYIGFPFINSSNEDEYMAREDYPQTIQLIKTSLLSSDPDQVSQLRRLLEGFTVGQECWESRVADGSGTEYDSCLFKSLASVVKKFPKVQETVVRASSD